MAKIIIFKNMVDGITYRSLDGVTVERREMLSGEWLPSKRDIRDIRNQSVSNVIEIAERVSTVTRFARRVRRMFKVV